MSGDFDKTILMQARLTIDNAEIRIDKTGGSSKDVQDAIDILEATMEAEPPLEFRQIKKELERAISKISRYAQRETLALSVSSTLHKGLHKGLHKALHKGLHKGLHKALHKGNMITGVDETRSLGSIEFSWPEIELPWKHLSLLDRLREHFQWDILPLPPPEAEGKRLGETATLLKWQEELLSPGLADRRRRIVLEAGNDLTAYMLPLGADVTSPFGETATLFQLISALGGAIGQHYKARFMAARPSVLEPNLRPFIPVPAHSSYPSNHALQSFLIAELFARTVPEHPGIPALFRAAEEVAVNREWAGLHLPSDTEAGRKLARMATPMLEAVLEDQLAAVRAEWY
ncbi:MAG: phosphatase PAP2 family protein [Rhodobacterales bacterium]|nr:phosphatase PAP2 family protein [Rhodobacterales bacterium]